MCNCSSTRLGIPYRGGTSVGKVYRLGIYYRKSEQLFCHLDSLDSASQLNMSSKKKKYLYHASLKRKLNEVEFRGRELPWWLGK